MNTERKIEAYARARVAIIRLGDRLSDLDDCTQMLDACVRNDCTLALFDDAMKRMGIYDQVLDFQSEHRLLGR